MRSRKVGRSLSRGTIAGVVVLTLFAGPAVAGPAQTRRRIADAKQQLAALENQISTQQHAMASLAVSIRTLAGHVARAQRGVDAVQAQIAQTQAARAAVETHLRSIQEQIANAAADAYMRGPGYAVEAVLQQDSLADASNVMGYAAAIARHAGELADMARTEAARLADETRQQKTLLRQRANALRQLVSAQNALSRAFIESQARLQWLDQAQVRAAALLTKLRAQLRAEELAAALRALANGTPMSFGRWATAFLGRLGAPIERNNLVVIVSWETAEYTNARWNPLATTWPMPGATTFNGSGVRNYVSLSQGLDATIATLRRPGHGYGAILTDLAGNADPMTTARAINASDWCHGCANGRYVIDLVPVVERYFDSYARSRAGA